MLLLFTLLFANITAGGMAALQATIAHDGVKVAWIEASRVTASVFVEPHATSSHVCRFSEILYGFDKMWTRSGQQEYAIVSSHDPCAAARDPAKRILINGSISDEDLRGIVTAVRKGRRVQPPPSHVTNPDGSTSVVESVDPFEPVERSNSIGSIRMQRGCAHVLTSRRSGPGQELTICNRDGMWTITRAVNWVA